MKSGEGDSDLSLPGRVGVKIRRGRRRRKNSAGDTKLFFMMGVRQIRVQTDRVRDNHFSTHGIS